MLALEGKTSATGTFQRWVRRRAAAMNKEGAASITIDDQDAVDIPDDDDDDVVDGEPFGISVVSGNVDEFEELGDDNGI
ncbi:unnamed protein product [Tilletia laevis]|nr:unnamed protein product [Tilletia laevis]